MRRLVSFLVVGVAASVTVVAAQPKKTDPKKTDPKKAPVAPAKDAPVPAPAPDAGSGSAVAPPEEPPPKDIEGRDENPGKPGGLTVEEPVVVAPVKKKAKGGYPIEEAQRPINLPANMSEVSIGPHVQVDPYQGTDALRARYGITKQVQLGLTYVLGSVYNENEQVDGALADKQKFHTGKAIGLDVTVLLTKWIGVRLGVPVYLKPVAVSLTLGAPMKFRFGDKFAVGGLDDLLNIRLSRFAPSFYHESLNHKGEFLDMTNAAQSNGQLRISLFGVYNHTPKIAIIGRTGFQMEDFKSNKQSGGGLSYFLRAGANFSPRKYLDLGISVGFDDLAEYGTFGPAGFIAFRI